MRCGRDYNAIECLNQILNFLPKFDLDSKPVLGRSPVYPLQAQILLTTRAEAWLKLCKMENALKGF